MAKDWAADVKKFVPDADDAVIAGIVRYCGIALQRQDSSLVSMSDPVETGRVRENFLKKKLGLTHPDDALDAVIAKVGERMKSTNFKNRVTVYYLLLEELGLLHLFRKPAVKTASAGAGLAAGTVAAGLGVASAAAAGLAHADDSDAALPGSEAVHPLDATVSPDPEAMAVAATAGDLEDRADPVAPVATASAIASASVGAIAASASGAADSVASTASSLFGTAGNPVAGASGTADRAAGEALDSMRGATNGARTTATHTAAAVAGGAGAVVAGIGSAGAAMERSLTVGDAGPARSGLGWLWWLLLGLGILALLWWLFLRAPASEPATTPPPAAVSETSPAATVDTNVAEAAPVATDGGVAIAIPQGAGVTSETREGKPFVAVYFDTAKADVVPAFTPAATAVKAYLDANPAATISVSGFNDPRGNPAANAALSKRRAEAVKGALVAAGIADAKIALVKPDATTDSAATLAGARRVEVAIR